MALPRLSRLPTRVHGAAADHARHIAIRCARRRLCVALAERPAGTGSADGGNRVLRRHDGVAHAAAATAAALRLKPHRSGVGPARRALERARGGGGASSVVPRVVVATAPSRVAAPLSSSSDAYETAATTAPPPAAAPAAGALLDPYETSLVAPSASSAPPPLASTATADDGSAELCFPGDVECHFAPVSRRRWRARMLRWPTHTTARRSILHHRRGAPDAARSSGASRRRARLLGRRV